MLLNISYIKITTPWDFPGGSVKNLSANAGDTGSVPDLGRSYMPQSNESRSTTTTEPVL